MLKLTKKADYGLMALKYLAEHPETPALSAKDVADAYGIPAQLLAKILQQLTKSGLLRSTAGMNGGYALAREARTISAYEVILPLTDRFLSPPAPRARPAASWSRAAPSRSRWRG